MPIALGAFGGLSGWILLSSRALRGTLPDEVTRLGVLSGGGVLASGVVTGGALLLPRASVLRRATLAVGAAPGVLGMLAVPVWFLRLGREPATDVSSPWRSRLSRDSA